MLSLLSLFFYYYYYYCIIEESIVVPLVVPLLSLLSLCVNTGLSRVFEKGQKGYFGDSERDNSK